MLSVATLLAPAASFFDSSRPSPSSSRASVRSHPLSSVSGRSICSRERRSCASTCGCSIQLSPARRAWRAARSSPQPCPSAHEPAEQLREHPMSVWRKLPLTAKAAAAYAPRLEDGLPSNTSVRQTQRRGARAEPRQLHAAGLSRGDGLAGDRRWRCARGGRSQPGAGGRSWDPGGSWQA